MNNSVKSICNNTDQTLLDFLNDELEEAKKEKIEAHIAVCPSCQSKLGSLASTLKMAKLYSPGVPDDTFWVNYLPKVRARIEEERSRKWLRKLVPAFAVITVFFISLTISHMEIRETSKSKLSDVKSENTVHLFYLGQQPTVEVIATYDQKTQEEIFNKLLEEEPRRSELEQGIKTYLSSDLNNLSSSEKSFPDLTTENDQRLTIGEEM